MRCGVLVTVVTVVSSNGSDTAEISSQRGVAKWKASIPFPPSTGNGQVHPPLSTTFKVETEIYTASLFAGVYSLYIENPSFPVMLKWRSSPSFIYCIGCILIIMTLNPQNQQA